MRARTLALALGPVIVLTAALVLPVVLRSEQAGAEPGVSAVATVLTTVYVDPSRAAARHQQGTGITVTVPPIGGDESAIHTPTGPPASSEPGDQPPSTGASDAGSPARAPSTTRLETSSTAKARHPDATIAPTSRAGSTGVSSTGPTTRSTGSKDGAGTPPALVGASAATVPTSHRDPITPAPSVSPTRIARAVATQVKAAAAQGITESVVVLNRSGGRNVVAINADRPVPAVSIAKLLFAADELDRAGGGANLGPDALADLTDMISRSNDALASDYYGYHGEGAIVHRVAEHYDLDGTSPAANSRYWGGITVTAADVASLLQQLLSDPATAPYLATPMKQATEIATDGFHQEFGMNAVSGAGSKQGWGCCLGGVVAIHSVGFTGRYIVAVLSTAAPDATGLNVPEVSAFEGDPGFLASVAAVTATVKAAIDPPG